MKPIRTDRLIIRRPTRSDLDHFLAYRNAPETLAMQAIELKSEESALEFLGRQEDLDSSSSKAWNMFALEHATEGKMIGEVGIFIQECGLQGDMGWAVSPNYHRQGYASEAAAALLQFAFEVRNLHRVTSNCDTLNVASIRIMQRLGMRHEATYIKNEQRHGEWFDSCAYAILHSEWQAILSTKS